MFSHSFALIAADGRLLDWDSGFESEFAVIRELLVPGLPWRDATSAAAARERFARTADHPDGAVTAATYDYRAADRVIHVELWPSAGGATVRTARDVTRERQFEDQALGRLTAGIAHGFNHLLMIALGNAESILKSPSVDADAARNASSIKRAVERCAALTRQLLAFTRQQPPAPGHVEPGELLRDFSQLILGSLGDDIQVHYFVSAMTWPILADPSQLEVALLNLVLNAREAMPDGGRVTLRAENHSVTADPRAAVEPSAVADPSAAADSAQSLPAGDYVLISIEDNGAGMNEETLRRACDPLITTKKIGAGAGLGLGLVHGFVRQSGGMLRIRSAVGAGTTVRMYLPRSARGAALPAAAPATAATRPEDKTATGRPQILLVDDHAMVRETLAATLKSLDYRVLVADRGASALAILESGKAVDLLFTDVVMEGGMHGPELAQRALALNPSIKVLFSSGFALNSLVQSGRLEPGVNMLMKPYDISQLIEMLERLLGASAKKAPDGSL